MKLAILGLAATAAIGIGTATAYAQPPVVVPGPTVVAPAYPAYPAPVAYPAYAPGVAVGGTIVTPVLSVGVYAPGIAIGVGPAYRYGYPVGGYYGASRGGSYPAHYYHGGVHYRR